MEDMLNNLKAHAKNVALTSEEKSAGREALRSYMSLTPNRTAQAQPARTKRYGFLVPSYMGRAAGVFAASLTLLLSAGGISYAAEGAVPGDSLYPVKVSFNEPIRAAMIVSEKDRAEWSAERASRRLAEAEVLASRGILKAETRVALDADFKRFTQGAEQHLAKVRQEDGGDGVAADVSAHIEGTLRAHSQIMVALAEDRREKRKTEKAPDAAGDDDEQQVVALAASIDRQADSATDKEDGRAKKNAGFARGRHDAAVGKIAEVRAWLSAKSGSFSVDSVAQASARLTAADAAVAAGDASLAAGDERAAFASYAKAQRLAQEARLIVRASNDLGVRIRFEGSDEKGSRRDGLNVNLNLDAGERGGPDGRSDNGRGSRSHGDRND